MGARLHSAQSSSTIRMGLIRPSTIVRNPRPRGSLNRFGPADPGLKQQRAAEPFGFWLVRVAKHTDIRLFALKKSSPVLREPPAFVQNMTNGDAAACQFDYGLGRIRSVRHRRRCL